jgi:helicase
VLQAWAELYPSGLNPLQVAAVNEHRVLDGASLLVVAPTSSGKTFVGEMAAAKAIAEERKAAFLFPYKALVNEKFDQFARLYGETLGLHVVRCTGDYLDQTAAFVRGKYDLAVLTYEMFLNLTVANAATLDLLGLVVIDEAQFISNPTRGISVELLLTNLLAARERGVSPQLVGLSAVIGDLNAFDEWLGCGKLVRNDRPVPLVEGVIDRIGTFEYIDAPGHARLGQLIPSHAILQRKQKPEKQDVIVPLVRSLLARNPHERVIVFRNKKGSARGCANYLAEDLGLPPAADAIAALPAVDTSASTPELRKCLSHGTAFHTTDLSRDELVVVERAFRTKDGQVKVLAATTTVSAGINTPASTVIIAESEFLGEENQPYTVAEYKNMAGRAGRLGYNEEGRSIIVADTPTERQNLFRRYVLGRPEPIRSSFDPAHTDTWVLRLLAQVKRVLRGEVPRLLASTYGGFLRGRGDPGWHARTVAEVEALLTQMTELGLADEEDDFVRLTLPADPRDEPRHRRRRSRAHEAGGHADQYGPRRPRGYAGGDRSAQVGPAGSPRTGCLRGRGGAVLRGPFVAHPSGRRLRAPAHVPQRGGHRPSGLLHRGGPDSHRGEHARGGYGVRAGPSPDERRAGLTLRPLSSRTPFALGAGSRCAPARAGRARWRR